MSSGTRLNVRPSLLRSPVPRLLPGFAIFLLCFGAIDIVEAIYDRYHVLDQTNTLFDADPNKVLVNFSTSWGNDTYFRHPWVDFVFSIPVRASAKVHCQVFGCDTARARRLLGLVITPVFGGVKNVLLYIIFTEIGLTPASASLLCAVNLLAFSSLTIGSIPETFPVSSTMVVLFVALMVTSLDRPRDWRMGYWIAAGAFATGITVTNVVPLVICFFWSRRRGQKHPTIRAVRDTMYVATATVMLTFAVAAVASRLSSGTMIGLLPSAERGDFGRTSPGTSAPEQIAIDLADAFVPVIQPQIVPNRFPQNQLDPAAVSVLDFGLTYANRRLNDLTSIAWTVTSLALVALGAYRASQGTEAWKSLAYVSMALLAFNVGIHLVFYLHDMYLYSLDWGVPLLFMLAGLMRKSGTRSYTGLVIAIVVGSAFASYYALSPFINAAGQLPK